MLIYSKDALGSITELTNPQGQLVQRRSYDEYGNQQVETIASYVPATDRIIASHAFTGRPQDRSTISAISYHKARWYEPITQNWMSPDPIGFGGGDTNLYRYVGGSPKRFVDPSGLVCEYSQETGKYSCWLGPVGPDKPYAQGTGYAGSWAGLNNPDMQSVSGAGPLPQGWYEVGKMVPETPGGLRDALPLKPREGTNTFGRGPFFIHGDNEHKPPFSSSEGCPIIKRTDRFKIPAGESFLVSP